MSRVDFAFLFGVDPVTVWHWEKSPHKPSAIALTLLELLRDYRKELLPLLRKRAKQRLANIS